MQPLFPLFALVITKKKKKTIDSSRRGDRQAEQAPELAAAEQQQAAAKLRAAAAVAMLDGRKFKAAARKMCEARHLRARARPPRVSARHARTTRGSANRLCATVPSLRGPVSPVQFIHSLMAQQR